ncbi:TIGR03086 family metal-binding protein [Pseudosporangium ferrugineum]|uniref:TIGR03086 family metal-binding protein n=1 Tax=Pseudosporangium ferrugineum TaxID=439699 RepID=UPI0013049969|nr:TIGR03086 family metal-binding protein [Pseudosporangium ferrugineum]
MTTATVDQLTATAERVDRLIAGIKPDQWSEPTPCPEWDVQALVSHLVLGNAMVTSALTAEPMTFRTLRAGFDESVETLTAALRRPGALDRTVEVPFGRVSGVLAVHLRLTELLVHGWDLARATGQPTGFADDVVEQELAHTAPMLTGMPGDRRPFAAPVTAEPAAPPLDRLAALLGRRTTG